MIPRNLIFFWDDLNNLPIAIVNAIEVSKKNNSNYHIIMADDAYMYEFIQNNHSKMFLELYKLNQIAASRSDIARLMLLYEFGGFYVDASMQLQKNLDTINNHDKDLVLIKKDDGGQYKNCPNSAHHINGLIGAKPKSKFIKSCIEQLLVNLILGKFNNTVIQATGPGVIRSVIAKQDNLSVKEYNISYLRGNLFLSKKVKGINSSWVCQQSKGIIKPNLYKKGRSFNKVWNIGRLIIHFSIGFLLLKKKIN